MNADKNESEGGRNVARHFNAGKRWTNSYTSRQRRLNWGEFSGRRYATLNLSEVNPALKRRATFVPPLRGEIKTEPALRVEIQSLEN